MYIASTRSRPGRPRHRSHQKVRTRLVGVLDGGGTRRRPVRRAAMRPTCTQRFHIQRTTWRECRWAAAIPCLPQKSVVTGTGNSQRARHSNQSLHRCCNVNLSVDTDRSRPERPDCTHGIVAESLEFLRMVADRTGDRKLLAGPA
jgi:hypothetical protein